MEDTLVGILVEVDRRQSWYSSVQGPRPNYPVYDYYFYCKNCYIKYFNTATRYKIWQIFLSYMGKCRQPCAQCRKELNPNGQIGFYIGGIGREGVVQGSLRLGVKSSKEILDPGFTL